MCTSIFKFLTFLGLPCLSFDLLFGRVTKPEQPPQPSVELTAPIEKYTQPTTTNDWFSMAQSFPTSPIFVQPGAYQITEKGIIVSSPQVHAAEKTVFGSFTPDCTVGFDTAVTDVSVARYSDWHVLLDISLGQDIVELYLTQGAPISYLKTNRPVTLECNGAQMSQTKHGAVITQGPRSFIFERYQGEGVTITDQSITINQGEGWYRVGVLPNTDTTIVDIFTSQPWQPISDTSVSFNPTQSTVETTFDWTTKGNDQILTTLWPHHQTYAVNVPETLATYNSVHGQLNLVRLNQLTLHYPQAEMPRQFMAVTDETHRLEISTSIEADASRYLNETPPSGVYFKGTWIGALTSLVQLADIYGLDQTRDQLVDRLAQVLVSGLENEFYYDADKKLYVAKKPEFGNEQGNDHHFHYGYYIRAASILVEYQPNALGRLKPTITEMVNDIATQESDGRYPRLRSHSVYEGHSWADAFGKTGDGNNQESTSEALNAWYALKLWGETTNDQSLVDLGTSLYAQELAATQAYWFGVDNPFPQGYGHEMASIVWHGKRDFATWFSGEPLHIYGIQWLPITPASNYLTSLASNPVYIQEIERLEADPYAHEWGDLYTAYLSYADPQTASDNLDRVTTTNGLKLASLLLQTVYGNGEK